jgi:hypothetical protein
MVYPDGSDEGLNALRSASYLVAEQYGLEGMRDLAEVLAADIEELMTGWARMERVNRLDFLDRWTHDEPMPHDDGP